MNAPTTLTHYQAMAEQAQRDSAAIKHSTGLDAANETSARGPSRDAVKRISSPLLISQYIYEGIAFNVYGAGHETGKCTIDTIKVSQCAVNFYRLIPADAIQQMTAECDRIATARLTAIPYANDAEFQRR